MQIEPFGVEQWMNAWETKCELNLAETCVASLTLSELMQMAGTTQQMPSELAAMQMTYGEIRGSTRLRGLVAGMFAEQAAENVLITHGTIGANHMVYQTLVGAGDHVVAVTPTYQQHTAIPRSLGAKVTEVALSEAGGWLPDWDAVAAAVTPSTKVIALTNPNNPTGALIDRAGLECVVEIARSVGAWVLCDEVYRGTEQGVPAPSIVDVYDKGISTGSTSKAFSLAGLRLGWIIGPESLLDACEIHRDYTTISVGMVDDYFAAMALEAKDVILERSHEITRGNLAMLDAWVQGEPKARYVKPKAGTTAFVALNLDIPSYDQCVALLKDTGVMFTPGSALGVEGYVRIGFACYPKVLKEGLERVSEWLAKQPVAS
ncbi:Aspartate/methionine/tyrosine aminotransferase [Octadecabacter temperatus]|uniref:Aminotransferase n=1 Tax=Octadecabacter temperatus TaxID=1458307 RepID=A0A0K0Y9C6_9RHOB|nr:aminotransferase [Octadecabacter temperatus]AKS47564.1 Capreomycidine synthase [Octadecabacter temperatus]SIO41214.1 Aspartate/methionine/tyrosine aminotransferase [Octadecabacter temperatus]